MSLESARELAKFISIMNRGEPTARQQITNTAIAGIQEVISILTKFCPSRGSCKNIDQYLVILQEAIIDDKKLLILKDQLFSFTGEDEVERLQSIVDSNNNVLTRIEERASQVCEKFTFDMIASKIDD